MNSFVNNLDLLSVAFAGVGGVILGLATLIAGTRLSSRVSKILAAVVFAMLVLGSALAFVMVERQLGFALAALAAAWGLGVLARTAATGHLVAGLGRTLTHPQMQAGFLIVGSLLVVAGKFFAVESEFQRTDEESSQIFQEMEQVDLKKLDTVAFTDTGRELHLYSVADQMAPLGEQSEQKNMKQGAFALQVIRTGGVSVVTNCHGWVFTGGACWIRGEQVAGILKDNGYQAVSEPREDDVVIYRDAAGKVLHTALVRSKTDSMILLESKWGQAGRYVHTPEQQPYSQIWTYYRSERQGHVLRGIEKLPSDHKYPEPKTIRGT